jgi:hypothetical protein
MIVSGIMINNDTTFFLGYVEQGLGGADPLSPPISVSKNGTFAKWRGKLDFIDLRVTDLGLKHFKSEYEEILAKAAELGIEVVMTLPEWVPLYYELPPEAPPHIIERERIRQEQEEAQAAQAAQAAQLFKPAVQEESKEDSKEEGAEAPVEEPTEAPVEPPSPTKKKVARVLDRLTYFKNCYLGLPQRLQGNMLYQELSLEDCMPIIELAAQYGVKHLIVPVGQPGIYIDPPGEAAFKESFDVIYKEAKALGIRCHLRNGGMSDLTLRRLLKDYHCGYAYNIGIAELEGEDFNAHYQDNADIISFLIVQQTLGGYNKWVEHKEKSVEALKNYISKQKAYRASLDGGSEEDIEYAFKQYGYGLNDYNEARLSRSFNLGLFQNGDLNLVPLLKQVREDIEGGDTKYVLVEAVPNTKNNDFIMKTVLPGIFTGTF